MEDKTNDIKLGQAKNQATKLLSMIYWNMFDIDKEKRYKELVKQFYSWNQDLDKEILGKEGDGVSHAVTSFPQKPSPKQMLCPGCTAIIPKTWTRHDDCGWIK